MAKFVPVSPSSRLKRHTMAFRITSAELVDFLPFAQIFGKGGQSEALRWLITNPEVRRIMRQAMADARETSQETQELLEDSA